MNQPIDEIAFSFSDLKRVFIENRGRLKRILWSVSGIILALLTVQPTQFLAKAAFKEGRSSSESTSQLKEFFLGGLTSDKTSILSLMQSDTVLRHAIEALGMQVVVESPSIFVTAAQRIWHNIAAEFRYPLVDKERFIFRSVEYAGERVDRLELTVLDDQRFLLADRHGHEFGPWHLHEEIALPYFKGSLMQMPHSCAKGKKYRLKLVPWVKQVKKVRNHLAIRPATRLNPSVFNLYYTDRDRHVAAEFLNQVMQSFRYYLYQENEQITAAQLLYLGARKKELMNQWDAALEDHVVYLKQNVALGGGFNCAQEVEYLQKPQQNYLLRQMEIDVELQRLQSHTLKSSQEMRGPQIAHELTALHQKQEEAALALQQLRQGKELPGQLSILNDPQTLVGIWAKQVFTHQQSSMAHSDKKQQLEFQLENFLAQTSGQIKALEENQLLCTATSDPFAGLNLSTAQNLFLEYNQQKDHWQAQLKQLIYLLEQLYHPHFELSAISTLLSDPVTGHLVVQAGETALQLQDASNRSLREQEYLQETLRTQKRFIAEHLSQIIELTKLRLSLAEEQIYGLRRTILSLLELEKNILQEQIGKLGHKMEALPEKWRQENQLLLNKEIGIQMMKGLAQLTEAKNIDRHLYHVGSKPLDSAYVPLKPRYPWMVPYAILAGCIAVLSYYMVLLFRAMLHGFPVSHPLLKAMGWNTCGTLSLDSDECLAQMSSTDLEVLRRMAQFIAQVPIVAIVGGKNPDFSSALAELLAMQQKRVLVIRYIFNDKVAEEDRPGLSQYLHQEINECPIRSTPTYDYLPSGGTDRYSQEMLSHPRLQTLLETLKHQYDHILFMSRAQPSDAEGEVLCALADASIVTAARESKQALAPYAPLPRVTFVCFDTYTQTT